MFNYKITKPLDTLVSICCITYNHEKFIEAALDGFLMQETNFDFEILINDDCSEDRTVEILKDYQKRYPGRLDITFQQENQFSKGARPFSDMVFPRAKGKYIALCEGDDYWTDPHKLQKQVDFLEQHEDYSLCFHKCKMVDENNKELVNWYRNLEEKDYRGEDVLEKWSVPTASVMFRSKYLNEIIVHIKEHDYLFGDYPMWLTLMENGKARCLGDAMSVYRVHPDGMSRVKSKSHVMDAYKHYKMLKRDFNRKYAKVMNVQIGRFTFDFGKTYFKKGEYAWGVRFILISFFHDKKQAMNCVTNQFAKLKKQIIRPFL